MGVLFIVSTLTIDQDFKEFDEGGAKFKAKEYAVIKSFIAILDNPAHKKQRAEDLYFYRGQAYFYTDEYIEAKEFSSVRPIIYIR